MGLKMRFEGGIRYPGKLWFERIGGRYLQCGIGGERSRYPRAGGHNGRRGSFRLGGARDQGATI